MQQYTKKHIRLQLTLLHAWLCVFFITLYIWTFQQQCLIAHNSSMLHKAVILMCKLSSWVMIKLHFCTILWVEIFYLRPAVCFFPSFQGWQFCGINLTCPCQPKERHVLLCHIFAPWWLSSSPFSCWLEHFETSAFLRFVHTLPVPD